MTKDINTETVGGPESLHRTLGNIETNQKHILNYIKTQDARLNSHSSRLATVEKKQAWTLIIGAGFGMLVSNIKNLKDLIS